MVLWVHDVVVFVVPNYRDVFVVNAPRPLSAPIGDRAFSTLTLEASQVSTVQGLLIKIWRVGAETNDRLIPDEAIAAICTLLESTLLRFTCLLK